MPRVDLPPKNDDETQEQWIERAWPVAGRTNLLDAMDEAFGYRAKDMDIDHLTDLERNKVLAAYYWL